MGQNFEFRDPISYPAAKVMEKMLDAAFLKEWTLVQQGLNPVVNMREKTADKALITIDLEEPLPKPLGTMKAHMTFTWNIPAMRMNWTREGVDGMSKKATIRGETRIEAKGADACDFVEVIYIDIPVPFIGKQVEKGIAEYLKSNRPAKLSFLKKNLG